MKRLVALFAGIAFVAGTVGFAAAQTPAKPMEKPAEKKMDKKPAAKHASGTVKSTTPDSIVVAGKDKGKDAEWTFAVDAKTKVKKGGKDVAAKDLAPGDAVQVRYMDDAGKAVAQTVTVKAGADKKADAMAKKPAEKK